MKISEGKKIIDLSRIINDIKTTNFIIKDVEYDIEETAETAFKNIETNQNKRLKKLVKQQKKNDSEKKEVKNKDFMNEYLDQLKDLIKDEYERAMKDVSEINNELKRNREILIKSKKEIEDIDMEKFNELLSEKQKKFSLDEEIKKLDKDLLTLKTNIQNKTLNIENIIIKNNKKWNSW